MGETFEVMTKTLYGLEEILAEGLLALGADDLQIGRRMVSSTGDKELLYKTSFHCHTAPRVLKPIYHFKIKNADTIYREMKKIEREKYLSPNKAFAIDSVIYSENFNHSKFVAYRTGDAIMNYFIEKSKRRPSVCVNNPDLYINTHISHNDCTLSTGSSGESLHKRGYRVGQTGAPLNEALTVDVILKTGWKGESNFVDPMCSSDTLLIEAAMTALNIVPGIHRKEFVSQKWIDYDEELSDRIYSDENGEREFTFHCYDSDISQAAINITLKNIRSAGLMKHTGLKMKPFQRYTEASKPGILVTSPSYGEHTSSRNLLGLYNMIGERLKYVFMRCKARILSYKNECLDEVGLCPSEKIELINGSSECEYRYYGLFEGVNKDFKKALNEDGEECPHRSEGSFERRDNDCQNFCAGRVDRPERRFAAAHSEDDEKHFASIPGKRIFGEDRRKDRPVRKKFMDASVRKPIKPKGECLVKMRYWDEDDRKKGLDGYRRDGKRPFNKSIKPIKRRGYDDYED